MYPRLLQPPRRSFFLWGPRGTGKSTWVRAQLPGAVYVDLLESETYLELLAAPQRLEAKIPPRHRGWVIIDEVQRVPALLDEVHRLLEGRGLRFALTGSSARKLRRGGVNLLAGRALTLRMHPLTRGELGEQFDLRHSLRFGGLPVVQADRDPRAARAYLASYVQTYLREEVMQEGLARNLAAFGRFLEAASFSQAAPLNIAAVARDCHVERKVVEDYFGILEDLLIGLRVPVFARRAKRRVAAHPKFYLFDAGVFRAARPRGPLDTDAEIDGAAAETLMLEELRALNDCLDLGYGIHYWRTPAGLEIDFVLYGERGLCAFEVKRGQRVRDEDLRALRAFLDDYPMARAVVAYGGTRRDRAGPIRLLPYEDCLRELPALLRAEGEIAE
jgi:predicted AAA+ superfamily ATPase